MQFSQKRLVAAVSICLSLASTASIAQTDHSEHSQHDAGAAEHLHHQHGKDSWMLEYRFMRMHMEGNLDGQQEIDTQAIFSAGYDNAPTSMTMEMHMLMAMYGITDSLTIMGMFNQLSNTMEMSSATDTGHNHAMRSSGTGDTQLYAMYQPVSSLIFSLGASLPTGSIDEKTADGTNNLPFVMQLGSGSLDIKPALTINVGKENWAFGAQGTYTYRTDSNQNGYKLGDRMEASSWVKYATDNSLLFSSRLALSHWQSITGLDENMISATTSSAANPDNQGGTRVDAFFGISGMSESGLMLGVEMGLPVFQDLNGPQMKTGLIANASIQLML